MTKRIQASEIGLEPHWKVRVVLSGAILHLASKTEPTVLKRINPDTVELEKRIDGDWIDDPEYGDTIGWIDWGSVSAVTWRWSP